jgi:hypothetical protein
MHVFFLGYPGPMGGANTECWHTAKVWRQAGIDVTFIPTWGCDPATEARLAAIGCSTLHVANAEALRTLPTFAGSIVVGMCNNNVTRARQALLDLRCRLVWVNCMTFLFPDEAATWRIRPADAYVFQSEFQKNELEKHLLPLGYNGPRPPDARKSASFGGSSGFSGRRCRRTSGNWS